MTLEENVSNRAWLVARVRAEVVGPDPAGEPVVPVNVDQLPTCTWEEFRKPRKQINGEEVLWQDPPLKRFGAGILYPAGSHLVETGGETTASTDAPEQPTSIQNDSAVAKADEKVLSRGISDADDSEDYDVSLANAMSPSAMGLSFLAALSIESKGLLVELTNVTRTSSSDVTEGPCARYKRAKINIRDDNGRESERQVWLRNPLVTGEGKIPSIEVSTEELKEKRHTRRLVESIPGLEVVIVSRPWAQADSNGVEKRLLTVTLVNRTIRADGSEDELAIFQSGLRVSGISGHPWIAPYPESGDESELGNSDPLADGAVNWILYRSQKTFAIGHGCSADWSKPDGDLVGQIWSDVMPVHETPATTAELEFSDTDGEMRKLQVSMRKLAGLDPEDSGWHDVGLLIAEYESWIRDLEHNDLPDLPERGRSTGQALIERCRQCLSRIRDGIELLESDTETGRTARKAFLLANHAMLIAQLRGGAPVRTPDFSAGNITWSRSADAPNPLIPHDYKGYWRPFQIAFLLMSLRGICDPEHEDREIVDLIWFPTGGGKTEAYLGVTAFTIFFKRLAERESEGCEVLMRYTLRLLTAQQFQRAATLFCAMDHLRSDNTKELGSRPFSLGLWVGGDTTPNTRAAALSALTELERNPTSENPFVLLQCPWCAAQMGPVDAHGAANSKRGGRTSYRRKNDAPSVIGYVRAGAGADKTVAYQCADTACEFGSGSVLSRGSRPLPISAIDEDLIESPPRLLIGTVDKFAMLAWKPELRSFFGLSDDGQHHSPPPSLIIQDELHLISGPLGTMVGAYEMVIDRLCREHGVGDIGPKIIASTATISRAREQIRHLYARKDSMLFPPSGLKSSDSFFAREASGPGRMYLGVLAPGHYSLQTTEARVFSTLLQSVPHMPADENGKDPWWTLLCFFNSLRELGSAATLMVADVREYMRVLMDRHGWEYKSMRNSMASELTSRIRGDDIPKELARLEINLTPPDGSDNRRHPVDVCLASNIIEVGVDLPRLSLMAVVGQPKSTSQYIQVSSRVGRGKDKPGLVVVLYGQSKPRDRSHYERFRGYHQKLYAQVEPTSVTPFSTPAIERALQGIILSAVRQLGEKDLAGQSPRPFPVTNDSGLDELLIDMLKQRADTVTHGEETESVLELLRKRLSEWKAWDPAEYGTFGNFPESPPLMYPAGANAPAEWNGRSWPVLSSLRNVDASGEAEITDWFNTVPIQEGQL